MRKLGLAALAALTTIAPAHAGVNVQSHTPVANTSYVMTEDALLEVLPWDSRGRHWYFGADYNWVDDPFVELNQARTVRTATLVDGINTLDLTGGMIVNRRISLNMTLPVSLAHIPGQSYSAGFGDLRLFAKFRLTNDDAPVAFSVIPEVRLPTGATSLFLSDGSMSPGVTLAAERDFEYFRASFNIGYRYSGEASFRDLNYTERLPIGLGIYVPISEKWGANAEATGALTLPRNAYQNPGEVYAGARYLVSRDLVATGGFGIGTLSAARSNDFRTIIGLKYSPLQEDSGPAYTPVVANEKKPEKKVTFTDKQILIAEEVKFQHNKAELTPAGRRILDEVAQVLEENRKQFKKILIEGHTNELGTIPYNQKLSEARARSVKAYLMKKGIEGKALDWIGYGELRPKKLPGFPKYVQLELNRRVEFKVEN